MTFSRLIQGLAVAGLLAFGPHSLHAQNLFKPVARINDTVVTGFEVQQRQSFLKLLNAPGSDYDSALQSLIDDRLRARAVADAGLELTPEGLEEGLEEFAGRANLTKDEFIKALEQSGVDRTTLRDFVSNTLGWRELIRARYLRRVNVTEQDIDRALGNTRGSADGIRVLLSEIIIPAPPRDAARVTALAERISQSTSEGEFSNYARQYSATASRGRGGRMPWTPLENLPPALHPILLALGPGDVSAPLPIPNAVALFQLRGIEETGAPARRYSEIEYAAYYMAGGRSPETLAAAQTLRGQVDVCDDLYGIAQGQPESTLDRETKAPAEIAQDFGIELAKLDLNEVSTALTRNNGQTLVFLMLCDRVAESNSEASREDVQSRLRQDQLQGFANVLMEQLRADARIVVQ
ncbi:Peptidyl-prolyl cis-trans isomerase SurA [Sulfitobacter noctilucicola]|uniref:Parvulin-like PPIase n=1 Tax=Sulfitobacter noctilucicola TaxID=1342301 RepID=A0A7W6M8A5_9RHOB|nr:peptidylprolyl isomerase [Sulfitobacter noctilucicola]KIN64874.1 Peptidyl-prolyl cis-trans isomerase SurA [Sulfitobacter noctilucicola]MBB4173982.1 peptidyl-prolyl cis-trans isomerase SurA [Sulfitobacter noctilucicola]